MSTLTAVKAGLRKDVKARLKLLSAEELEGKSAAIVSRLFSMPAFAQSRVVCCYLSMPTSEVRTAAIIQSCFEAHKRLFIPKVTGKEARDLHMLEVANETQLEGFPKSSWGIPEPPLELVLAHPDGCDLGIIDLVIVPGVAFDSACGRLGHGKGYYDCFLSRLRASNAALSGPVPALVGLALDEQLVEAIPSEAHDQRLDFVVTPTTTYSLRS